MHTIGHVGALAIAALAGLLLAQGDAAADDEVPFPVSRSQILRKEGTVYYVEGTQRIPKGVEISCQKDVRIRGRGPNAVLEVEGSLQVHGVSAREVIFEDVLVRTAPNVQDLQLDMCIFRGAGGVTTAAEMPSEGKIFLEHVTLEASCRLELAFTRGNIDLSSVKAGSTVRIVGAVPEGAPNDDVKLKVRDCSFTGGLEVLGVRDVTVRINRLLGARSTFQDCEKFDFDGNKVTSKVLEFRQSAQGGFGATTISKCDLYCERIEVYAPANGSRGDTVRMDKCWFKGAVTDEKQLHATVLVDASDTPEPPKQGAEQPAPNGARIALKNVQERPLELAGAIER